MTFCDVPQIRISDPGDLIETIPYLLGFHPVESLVVIGFTDPEGAGSPQRVQVTMRVDLPESPLDAEVFRPLTEALLRAEASAAAVVLFAACTGDPRDSGALQALAAAVSTTLRAAAVDVLDVLVASDKRWWSLVCQQPTCCPPQGTLRSIECSFSAAQATFAGLVALPDRDSLSATLTGLSPQDRAALEPALADAEHRVARAALAHGLGRLQKADLAALLTAAERARLRSQLQPLSRKQLARFGVALGDSALRDSLWLAIDEQSLDATELLHDLHTRLPAPYDAAPLFLWGWGQWRAGNGTLAMMAAERALESDPDYSAAILLVTAVQHGMDPRTTPALRDPDLFDSATFAAPQA